MADGPYAGDVAPAQAWDELKTDPRAVLVDVRTDAEWAYVGLPDLKSLGKETLRIAWQLFPDMRRNPEFVDQVRAAGVGPGQPVFLLCRSGVRSRSAAMALTEAGFGPCYNVADGFEGGQDEAGHRGRRAGWKVAGLPWVQG